MQFPAHPPAHGPWLLQAAALREAAGLAANLSAIFRIPADADDTGCHHALRARLAALAPLLPQAAARLMGQANAPPWGGLVPAAPASSSGGKAGGGARPGGALTAAAAAPAAAGMFQLLIRYAYRPGSALLGPSLLDPRSYFWLHSFLQQHRGHVKQMALVTTWLQVGGLPLAA
jgi:hypothetical protein